MISLCRECESSPNCHAAGYWSSGGRAKAIDGEAFFDSLRQREDELLKQRNPK